MLVLYISVLRMETIRIGLTAPIFFYSASINRRKRKNEKKVRGNETIFADVIMYVGQHDMLPD